MKYFILCLLTWISHATAVSDEAFLKELIGCQELTILPIEAGCTNSTFRVDTEKGRFIYRENNCSGNALGIQRDVEQIAQNFAANLGIAPKILSDPEVGKDYILAEFIEGNTLDQELYSKSTYLKRILALLKEIHKAPLSVEIPSNSFTERVLAMLDKAMELQSGLEDQKFRIFLSGPFQDFEKRCEKTLVHGDVWWENIIEADDGLYLIDWEYALVGPSLLDVSQAFQYSGLPKESAVPFLEDYLGRSPKKSEMEDFMLCLKANYAMSFLWMQIQSVLAKDRDIDYSATGQLWLNAFDALN